MNCPRMTRMNRIVLASDDACFAFLSALCEWSLSLVWRLFLDVEI